MKVKYQNRLKYCLFSVDPREVKSCVISPKSKHVNYVCDAFHSMGLRLKNNNNNTTGIIIIIFQVQVQVIRYINRIKYCNIVIN